MQMKFRKKFLSLILCMVLTVAMALGTTGCNGNTGNDTPSAEETKEAKTDVQTETKETKTDVQEESNVLGEGSTEFMFSVVDEEGNETQFEIHTDKETVGEALTELDLIEGEESEYGLYVKTVNGISADYDKDGVYWTFYVNDEYAQEGVDSTKIAEGDTYAFKIE